MKVLFTLGHPAHFHLYKHTIQNLLNNGAIVKIVITEKDILTHILDQQGFQYESIASPQPNEGMIKKAKKLVSSSLKLRKICMVFKPDLMVGCLTQMGIVGKLLKIPTIFNAEDDASYTFLQAILTYPFNQKIISPLETNLGIFNRKKIAYNGYHKLAYLHPKYFIPNRKIVEEAIGVEPYVLIRVVNLTAYHDLTAKGISETVLDRLIKLIRPKYRIFISAEKKLHEKYQQYQLPIHPIDVHHFLYFSEFFIADSQSMTVESAMLGVPNIKFNSFAGRISVLEELEHKYGLTIGINPKDETKLIDTVTWFLDNESLKSEYNVRRKRMLADKIDVTAFFTWFIINYPQSQTLMKDKPNFQDTFK